MVKKTANKKAETKYEKYFLKDVIHPTMKKEWGGEAISAGQGHEDIIPAGCQGSPGDNGGEKTVFVP